MFKRDVIFWCATGIFVLALALASVHYLFLFLLVGAYLLRPTLHSLGFAKKLTDERKMTIQYRSGNIGFSVLIVGMIVMAVSQVLKGENAEQMYMLICLGLAAKALANVLLSGDHRVAGVRITLAIGLLFVLFASLSHGLTLGTLIESAPGISVILIGLLGRKLPRIAGLLLASAAIGMVFFFHMLTRPNLMLILMLPLPLLIGAACFFAPEHPDRGADSDLAPSAEAV